MPSTWEAIRKRFVQSLEAEDADYNGHDARKTGAGRIITFLGVKGGVGTTTTALNVSAAWSKEGRSVVIAEMTPGFSSLSFQLGCERTTSTEFPEGSLSSMSIETRFRSTPFGMKLVTALPWQATPHETSFDEADSLLSISKLAELTTIDLRFDATEHVRQILQMTDSLVLVVERDEAAVHAAREVWRVIQKWDLNCWTGVVAVVKRSSVSVNLEEIKKQLPCQLWCVIAQAEEQLAWALQQRSPLVFLRPNELASQSYMELARTLDGTSARRSSNPWINSLGHVEGRSDRSQHVAKNACGV